MVNNLPGRVNGWGKLTGFKLLSLNSVTVMHLNSASSKPGKRRRATLIIFFMKQYQPSVLKQLVLVTLSISNSSLMYEFNQNLIKPSEVRRAIKINVPKITPAEWKPVVLRISSHLLNSSNWHFLISVHTCMHSLSLYLSLSLVCLFLVSLYLSQNHGNVDLKLHTIRCRGTSVYSNFGIVCRWPLQMNQDTSHEWHHCN